MTTAVLVIQTPSFSGNAQGSYWSSGKNSPEEAPNMITLASKASIRQWEPKLATIRSAIAGGGLIRKREALESKFGAPVRIGPIHRLSGGTGLGGLSRAIQRTAGMASEIERLAELHASGVLTDDEFARAKAKLLG